jgi:Helix-turn-helix domain
MSATSSPVRTSASATDVRNVSNPARHAKLTRPAASAQATVQHKPAKTTRNRIPPVQRVRVMQRYASGENQTAIARQEGINRETVGRIVKSAEMEAFTEEIRESWRGLCENAIQSVHRLIAKDDKQTVFRILESNGIIAPQGQVQNFSSPTAAKPTGDERVKELMGAFAAVAIERARVFKTPMPYLAEIAEENGIKLDFELDGATDESEEDEEIIR